MRTALITGANGNLGSAVTQQFLAAGYKVIATVVKDSMKDDFEPHDHLEVVTVDLTNEDATTAFVLETIGKTGKIDVALLLVGGFTSGDIKDTTAADIDKQITLNFKTAYHTARPVFNHMMEHQKGRIVLIGARPALVAGQGKNLIAYALSKSLLFKLAELLNASAKGKNVTVTVVVPSTLDTEINRKSMPDADPNDWVKPDELAALLESAVSDASSIVREPVIKAYNNA